MLRATTVVRRIRAECHLPTVRGARQCASAAATGGPPGGRGVALLGVCDDRGSSFRCAAAPRQPRSDAEGNPCGRSVCPLRVMPQARLGGCAESPARGAFFGPRQQLLGACRGRRSAQVETRPTPDPPPACTQSPRATCATTASTKARHAQCYPFDTFCAAWQTVGSAPPCCCSAWPGAVGTIQGTWSRPRTRRWPRASRRSWPMGTCRSY